MVESFSASADLLLLTGDQIYELLRGREKEILAVIKLAYQAHDQGKAVMPANSYLRFPGMEKERIIAKIAYLGEGFEVAGIKWISSFPGNVTRNLERASAAMILNSLETGRPTAVLEGSIVSAKRTAASAALAAECLWRKDTVSSLGLIGCGVINFETLRFLLASYPDISDVALYDLSRKRAEQFGAKSLELKPDLRVGIGRSFSEVSARSEIVSVATTAVTPHIESLDSCRTETLFLHLSVRDFAPKLILKADNIVDDVDQVCSHATSIHLAEQAVGHRRFVRCTLGEILNGKVSPKSAPERVTIFTPFGLGILDVAVASLAQTLARGQGTGATVPSFFPKPWLER